MADVSGYNFIMPQSANTGQVYSVTEHWRGDRSAWIMVLLTRAM